MSEERGWCFFIGLSSVLLLPGWTITRKLAQGLEFVSLDEWRLADHNDKTVGYYYSHAPTARQLGIEPTCTKPLGGALLP